jgi:hypothetical protein
VSACDGHLCEGNVTKRRLSSSGRRSTHSPLARTTAATATISPGPGIGTRPAWPHAPSLPRPAAPAPGKEASDGKAQPFSTELFMIRDDEWLAPTNGAHPTSLLFGLALCPCADAGSWAARDIDL